MKAMILKTIISIILFSPFYIGNSFSQDWIKINPQFSTGDTIVDLSCGVFITKSTGWVITNKFDSVGNVYNKLFKTTDGGYGWVLQQEYFNVSRFVKIFAIDSMHCWILGDARGELLITTNGGITWDSTSVSNKHWGWPFGGIFFFNAEEGIAVNEYSWLTTDGGKSWSRIDTTTLLRGCSDIHFGSRNAGWVSCTVNPWFTDTGIIDGTTDGGYTWLYQGDTVAQGKIVAGLMCAVDAIDSSRAFTISSDGIFGWTSNGGTKWNGSVINGTGEIFDVEFLNQDTGWVTGCCGRIWQTMDGGTAWSAFESGLNSNITRVNVLHNEKVVYAMGTNNALLRLDLVTSVKEHELELPTNFYLAQNYPNPFNPATNIRFEIRDLGLVTLKVFDVLGREIATLINELKQPGSYEFEWNAEGVSSGVYIYQIQMTGFIQTKKMILIR